MAPGASARGCSGGWAAGRRPLARRICGSPWSQMCFRFTKTSGRGVPLRRRALGQPVREAVVHRLGAKERVELRRIGVNLNQIARALNSGASAPAGTLEAVERVGELAAGLLTGEALDR